MDCLKMIKSAKLKATPQRVSTLKVLSKHTHPTIDELYDEVRKEHPSVSLATVYKNVAALIDAKLAIEFNAPNQKTRFDINEKPHINVICEGCGKIRDLYEDDAKLAEWRDLLEQKIGKKISRMQVMITVCDCKNC